MYFLSKELYFPPIDESSYEGVIAIGGDLSIERLLLAYRNGIFPWFNENDPILWWCPPDRMVVVPSIYKVSKSIRNLLNQNKFKVTFNQNFSGVIEGCQQIERPGQEGTWLSDDFKISYTKLHEMGIAKSVEVWQDDELVGGLYGIDLGHIFCGESMFSKVSNAKKTTLKKRWSSELTRLKLGITRLNQSNEFTELRRYGLGKITLSMMCTTPLPVRMLVAVMFALRPR